MSHTSKFFKLIGHSKLVIFSILVLFLISSFFEILGIGLVGWFIGALVEGSSLNFHEKSYLKFIEDFFPISLNAINTAIIISSIIIVRFIFQLLVNFIIIFLSSDLHKKIKDKIFFCTLSLDYKKFREKTSSETFNEITFLSGQFANSYSLLIKLLNDLILLILISFLLLNTSYKLFLLLSFLVFLLLLLNKQFLLSKITSLGEKLNFQNKLSLDNIKYGLEGFKQMKVIGNNAMFINDANIAFNKIKSLNIKFNFYKVFIRYIAELFIAIFLIAFSVIVTNYYSSQETIALLAIFGISSIRALPLIYGIINSANNLYYLKDTTNKLYEAVKNYDKYKLVINSEEVRKIPNHFKSFKNLKISNLDFNYKDKTIFQKLNLEIKKGEIVLITGPSGSGKTTLVDLILGLLEKDRGKFFLNDEEIKPGSTSLNSLVYYLPQKNFIFNDTLEKNITLSSYKINLDNLNESIKLAGLNNFYDSQNKRIQKKIGESGSLISGGEGQRIAFARALYADKQILILDEFTNALDKEKEMEVLNSIKEISKNKTIIIISHDTSLKSIASNFYKIKNYTLEKE
tara:strand:+ start:5630 stop:7345 length:1716 start_codon:yes stop_codon:yes gene_type:complete